MKKTIETRPGLAFPVEVTTETCRVPENGQEIVSKISVLLHPLELLRRRMVELLVAGAKSDAALPFKAAAELSETCPEIWWGVWLFVHTAILEDVRIASSAEQEESRDRYRRTGRGKRAARHPAEADYLIAIRDYLSAIAKDEDPFRKLRFFASKLAQQDALREFRPSEEPLENFDREDGEPLENVKGQEATVFKQVPDAPVDRDFSLKDPETRTLHRERHGGDAVASEALERALLPHLSDEGVLWFHLHDRLDMPKMEIQAQTSWSDRDYSRLQKEVSRAKGAISRQIVARHITELGTTFEEIRSIRASSAIG